MLKTETSSFDDDDDDDQDDVDDDDDDKFKKWNKKDYVLILVPLILR